MTEPYIKKTEDFCIINNQEFNWPLNEVITRLDLNNKFLFFVGFTLLTGFNGKLILNPTWEFDYDLVKEQYEYATSKGKKFYYIIECMPEAQNYFYELIFIDDHIKKIMKLCNLQPHQIINLSGAHDKFPTPYQHCISITQFGVGVEVVDAVATNIPKHHFISLSNWPRKHRVIATFDIWDRNLEEFGYVTLHLDPQSTGPTSHAGNLHLVPERYLDRLPCFIEGSGPAVGIDAFKLRNLESAFAFINLVNETSIEYGVCNFSWHSIFFTEKSIKPFAWGQVPLFNTIRHHVETIRSYGFDLFDDLIDHSYDNEIDPYKRISMVVDQLEKICRTMTLEDIQNFKRDNMHRFIKNRELAENHLHNDQLNMKITADNLTRCLNYQP